MPHAPRSCSSPRSSGSTTRTSGTMSVAICVLTVTNQHFATEKRGRFVDAPGRLRQPRNRDQSADDVLVILPGAHALDEEAHDVRNGHCRLAGGRAGEERIDVEQRHRHDSGAARVIVAVGTDARRTATLNRFCRGVPGCAGILLCKPHADRPATFDALLGRADHVSLFGAHGQ